MNPFKAIAAIHIPGTAKKPEAPVLTKGIQPSGMTQLGANPPAAKTWEVKAPDGTTKSFADVEAAQAYRESLNPAPAAVPEPTVAPLLVPEPAKPTGPILYATESNVAKVAPVIIPAAPAVEPAVQETKTVATTPVVPAKSNEFVKILKAIGTFFAKGITVADALQHTPAIQNLENITIGPLIGGLIAKVLDTAQTVETSSATAIQNASAAGLTDTQKADIVIAAITKDAQDIATQVGASALTQADIKIINDAAIAIAGVYKIPVPVS